MSANEKKKTVQPNYVRHSKVPLRYFEYIGFRMLPKPLNRPLAYFTLCNLFFILVHLIAYLFTDSDDFVERSTAINYISYFVVCFGKALSQLYNRQLFAHSNALLKRIYPREHTEQSYDLSGYSKVYLRLERVMTSARWIVATYFNTMPLVFSIWKLLRGESFTYRTPTLDWHPIDLKTSSIIWFCIYYVLEFCCTYQMGFMFLSFDLSLFCIVSQICMHFKYLAQKIEEIEPQQADSVTKLKDIIQKHTELLNLIEDINSIYTLAIRFNLLSSSFIICFNGYQMLENTNVLFRVKSFVMLCYELSQVVITCYYGDMLIQNTSRIFDSVYMHDWECGSLEYKRLVLFTLLRARKECSLQISGISNVSLVTLKEVLSISYQAFALLQTM